MYLSYTEYQEMGGQLAETEFNRLNFTAQAELDLLTFNRITDADERVKNCIFALISPSEITLDNVSSVSNDGYSINYADSDEMKSRQADIVYTFFANTDLMYRGTDGVGTVYTPQPDDGYEFFQVEKSE